MFISFSLKDGECMCGPNSACDPGRFCANETGVTYGNPNATFECSCSNISHCPNTTDTCNMDVIPSLCTCGDDPPCEVPSTCLNLTTYLGQPKCSCLDASDCLENADSCDNSAMPQLCQCVANVNSSVCDPGRICLNLTELPEQPPCSCLDTLDCLENADTCNSTMEPAMCECSFNDPSFAACEIGRTCLNLTENLGQPPCSCLNESHCFENADTCNITAMPPTCECSQNEPTFAACELGRVCVNVTENPGQPPCSCLNDLQCLENSDTCNLTTTPPSCECSYNGPDMAPCDPGRMCLNSTETPEQPACSCLEALDCFNSSDSCNTTAVPAMCGCSFNEPSFEPCEDGRICLNITEELGQPPCSCLNESHCFVNADTCNSTTHMCECSANAPTFAPCQPGRVCIPGFGCSCESDAQCAALGDVDICNATLDPPGCECSFNVPTFDPCDPGRLCVNVTENPGQPSCSCLQKSHCFENADFCNATTAPPTCECQANFGVCDPDRVCVDATVLLGQPPCSCLNVSHCFDNSDTCNTTTIPNTCQCSFNEPSMAACEEGRICLNNTDHPEQPACSCFLPDHCFDNADSCNSTLAPPMCECSFNEPSLDPCEDGRMCINITELIGQPPCSCLNSSQCFDNSDTCNDTAIPAMCECSSNIPTFAPCDGERMCLNVTENPGQPPCSCLIEANCFDNADSCNVTKSPPACECTANEPTLAPCDPDRICLNLTEQPGQPACSCLETAHCSDTSDTCNITASPPSCECSFNEPSFAPCMEGRICVNVTENPGQPGCSCLDVLDCAETSDSCNSTTMPPTCECSTNAPTFAPCDPGRMCINITVEVGQPPCSCLNSSDCFLNADSCNSTTRRCECSSNIPSFAPCDGDRVCIPGFGCSCEGDAQCADLGVTDTCNVTMDPPACECSFNVPNFEMCEKDRTCLNITENPGQPPCSCLEESHCFDNADMCNSTLSPPLCACTANSPTYDPCDPGRLCLNQTEFPCQPACSCLEDGHCPSNADNCNVTSSMCQCDINDACQVGSLCINNYTVTGEVGPHCTCANLRRSVTDTGCPATSNECDDSTDPPSCKCNGKDPCEMDRACLNVEGQPDCSCLTDDECVALGTSDCCDLVSSPPLCKCGNGTACNTGEECLAGECVVRIQFIY